jgi:hypothetical protein
MPPKQIKRPAHAPDSIPRISRRNAPHPLFDYYNPDASVVIAPERFVVSERAMAARR